MDKNILKLISRVHDLREQILSKKHGDLANFWEQSANLVEIRKYIFRVMQQNKAEFSKFADAHRKILFEYLQETDAAQREAIERYGIVENQKNFDGFFKEFEDLMKDFIYLLFTNYIEFETYDTFSENSRDNDKKSSTILQLSQINDKILEIGPGTGPIMRRLLKHGWM